MDGLESALSIGLVILFILSIMGTGVASSAEWSSYSFNEKNWGHTSDEIPRQNPTVGWTYSPEGNVLSSPVIADGMVYIATYSGDYLEVQSRLVEEGMKYAVNRTGNLYAFDLHTGEVVWKRPVHGSVFSSPAYHEGRVYVGTLAGRMYAVDGETGEVVWNKSFENPIYSPPTVSEDSVYFGTMAYDNHGPSINDEFRIFSLDPGNGASNWQLNVTGGVFGAPAVSNSSLVVGSQKGVLYSIDKETGAVRWEFKTENRPEFPDPLYKYGGILSAPAMANSRIYFTSYSGMVYALNHAGEVDWKHKLGKGPLATSPAVTDDRVYISSYDGNLYSFDSRTGEPKWMFPTTLKLSKSSPSVSNGSVLFGADDINIDTGNTTGLHVIDSEIGAGIWKFDTNSSILSSPAITEDMVVFSSLDRIYMIDPGGRQDSRIKSLSADHYLPDQKTTREPYTNTSRSSSPHNQARSKGFPVHLYVYVASILALLGIATLLKKRNKK